MSRSETSTTGAARARGETVTPPPGIQNRPILKKKIWERLHVKDKNWMGIVCGQTGSGKSEYALRLCELLDPNFTVDNVVFSIEGFMREVNRKAPRGSFILFDEVGVALSHATHYDSDQIRLNHVLETWREQNRGLVMTAPHVGLVQKASRGLLHAQMDMQKINYQAWLSSARYRYFQQNTDNGDIYKKCPRIRNSATGQVEKVRQVQLYRPSTELVEPYLQRKREFNDSLNEEVLAQVEEMEEDAEENLGPKDIAEIVLDEKRLSDVVSYHQSWKRAQLDSGLIQMEFDTTVREAKNVKKLLDRELTQGDLEAALNGK